jgi:hypothetical protein
MVHSKFNRFICLDDNTTCRLFHGQHISTFDANQDFQWAFPKGTFNKVPSSPNLVVYNGFGDFNFTAERLAFIDGDQDVWNGLCYHSPLAPARKQTLNSQPELLITGAGHHWDSAGILDVEAEPQFIREAHLWEIRTVKKWLREFDSWKSSKKALKGRPLNIPLKGALSLRGI